MNFYENLKIIKEEIRELYLADDVPWIIGYSGGKDSTAIVQLTWEALRDLDEEKRVKQIHVISTDTRVENPIVSEWVIKSHNQMRISSREQKMPFNPHQLMPETISSFWTNLIGKGYPAPRHKFRWCTERLKINPSNNFIKSIVKDNGEAILVLGTRKKESQRRAETMKAHEKHRVRDRLSPNSSLPGTLVYTPIEDWSNDEVWMYLMQNENPWDFTNKALLTMYSGASEDGECPLVVDTSTPSCGDSRFGCWVCTLVDQDKSMAAMIQNDDEKEWMLPLLDYRNRYLDFRPKDGTRDEQTDRVRRDFRRMSGAITLYNERAVHGPYTQKAREELLRELLVAQNDVRDLGKEKGIEHAETLELIRLDELEEIRRIWVVEKHETEDLLPRIYEEATGNTYPGKDLGQNLMFGSDELLLLKEVCGDDQIHYEMSRELLDIERQYRTMSRRTGLFKAIDDAITRGFYVDEADATEFVLEHQRAKKSIEERFEKAGVEG